MPREDQGVFRDRYSVIPRTLIFITHKDQVLLLKGSPKKRIWADHYNGIGGHIERGEDILSAARRELFEETGLEISDLWLCGNIMVDASDEIGISIFIFRGEYREGQILPSSEGELFWVEKESISDLPLVDDLFTLLPVVLNLERSDPPISAHTYYNANNKLIIEIL